MILLLWILIQIIGESLPISSSGHVGLMARILKTPIENEWMIDFLLHAPTIIILLIYFLPTWWKMIFQKDSFDNFKIVFHPALFIIIADLITFFFWMLNLSSIVWIQYYFLPIGFCITAFCLYFSKYGKFHKQLKWSWSDAMILGITQGLCLLPGISRFACTYAVGILLGYDRKNAFALSFLIQIPLLCAAFIKGGLAIINNPLLLQDFLHSQVIFTCMFASLISYKLFCWVARLIEQNRLWYFAFYMMIPICISFWIVKDVVS